LKNFDLTTILPLIGVAVGWLLSEAGLLFRARRDEKKILAKAILKLLNLRGLTIIELRRVAIAKSYAKAHALPEHRARLAQKLNHSEIGDFLASKDALLDEVATVDPFLAFELSKHFRSVSTFITNSGGYLSGYQEGDVEEMWDQMFLETEESMFNFLAAELRAAILRVASRKSLLSLVRAWWYFKRQTDEVYDETTLDKMQEMRERLKKVDESSKRKVQATKKP
jgi:hypothetical protein